MAAVEDQRLMPRPSDRARPSLRLLCLMITARTYHGRRRYRIQGLIRQQVRQRVAIFFI